MLQFARHFEIMGGEMLRILSIIMLAGVALNAFASESAVEKQVRHRRMVRGEIEARGSAAAEAYLRDADPGVRRYALYSLFAADAVKGKSAAASMANDPDDSVRSLAQELVRERRKLRSVAAVLPPSQNPANDHDLIKVLSVPAKGESFTLPQKPSGCDVVEMWLGTQKRCLMVWLNDVLVGEFDPSVDGGREFRLDVTKSVKWCSHNKVWITDDRGKDVWLGFSVEVFKCGN